MPNKPGPISYPELKQFWGRDFRAQKWPLEGVDRFILGGQPLLRRCRRPPEWCNWSAALHRHREGAPRTWGRLARSLTRGSPAPTPILNHDVTHQLPVAAQFDGRQQVGLLVIARSGVPIARLVAWQAPSQPVAAPGAMRGQITLAEDFNAPLDGLFEALQ